MIPVVDGILKGSFFGLAPRKSGILKNDMPIERRISYAVFAVLILATCALHLGPVILAGLFSFMILDLTHRQLVTMVPRFFARWLSVVIFAITAVSLFWLFGVFMRLAVQRMPVILGSVLPMIDAMAGSYGVDLPFENLQELRLVLIQAVKENARSITQTSGLLTRGFFQIVIGVLIAIANFLSEPTGAYRRTLYDSLRREFDQRMHLFMVSYEKVLGAQVVISLINTAITSIFVAATGIPSLHFLALATFILGVIPLIGNILSNFIIIGAALTLSPRHAVGAFVFLVVSHKAQYFLNSRIIGSSLKTPMWMTLLGILVGEVVLGVPGIILAPAIVHYVREELSAIPSAPA